jgi:SAM-dependent methyltransferase
MVPTLVDDFGDGVNADFDDEILPVHRSLGVEIFKRDALDSSLALPPGSFDAVTCFEAMEHWQGSPRELFRNAMDWLRPGGLFLVSASNCVDLKRRLSVPLGLGKWSDFDSWYGSQRFRGRVRECDRDDLRRIAEDLRLTDVHVFGRNWWPDRIGFVPIAAVARMLQIAPALCSTLYLSGRKAA